MNNAIGSYKYGNDFTISKITNSCMWFPSFYKGSRMWFCCNFSSSYLGTALLGTDNTRICRDGLKCQCAVFTRVYWHDVCTPNVGCADVRELQTVLINKCCSSNY